MAMTRNEGTPDGPAARVDGGARAEGRA